MEILELDEIVKKYHVAANKHVDEYWDSMEEEHFLEPGEIETWYYRKYVLQPLEEELNEYFG